MITSNLRITFQIALALLSISPSLLGQSTDTPIFDQHSTGIKEDQNEMINKAVAIREKVSAISKQEIEKQILAPLPEPVKLLPALTKEMSTEEIAEHARKSNLRVGYCYKCTSCENWHANLAGGYAIAPNVIVTCDHVLDSKLKMRDGFLMVYDENGNVACGVAVLARSAIMDAAIIKVAGAEFKPVPLNSNVKQGSVAYCFSYPLKQQGYFSTGIINRFYWRDTYKGEDKNGIDGLSHLRVNYSNDWAPGSSGSPLFDSAGNVTGHVSTIAGLSGGKGYGTFLLLHEGVAAQAVQRLVQTLDNADEIKRLASIKAPEKKAPVAEKSPDKKEDEHEAEEGKDDDNKTDLFAKGFDGWTFVTKEGEQPIDTAWKLKDGVLSTPGTPIGYIRTKENFKNYTLTFEWRWQAGTEKNNSGVLVHVNAPGTTRVWPESFEAQLQQGAAGDFWCIGETLVAKGESPNEGMRWVRIADPKEKPLGEWNTMTVTCTDESIEVSVNGVVVNEGKNLSVKEGAIAFQAEGAPIEIRNVMVTK